MVAMEPSESPGRTVYLVGGMGVKVGLGVDVTVGVEVGGRGVGVSVGGSVTVKVSVGVGGGVIARGRSSNPTTANSSTIPPAAMTTILPRLGICDHGNARAGLASAAGVVDATGCVSSAPQTRHVLARDETLVPQLGQVRGWVSERLGRFSIEAYCYCIVYIAETEYAPRNTLL